VATKLIKISFKTNPQLHTLGNAGNHSSSVPAIDTQVFVVDAHMSVSTVMPMSGTQPVNVEVVVFLCTHVDP